MRIISIATTLGLFFTIVIMCSCTLSPSRYGPDSSPKNIEGTWKLLTGTLIEKGDTTVTDYTKNVSFIKIINATHFSFVQHDLKNGKDSMAIYSSGAGRYTLTDSSYTEHLEYCSDRQWEGHDFSFTVEINGDTLIQRGIEKIENLGIERLNTEKYLRLKER